MTRTHSRFVKLACLVLLAACGSRPDARTESAAQTGGANPAQAVVDELLAVDRQYAHDASGRPVADALAAMMSDDVVVSVPPGTWAEGVTGFRKAIESNPLTAGATVSWAPIRGGVSADGLQGFTYGFMTVQPRDSAAVAMKYLSYWVKGTSGWKVAAFRRARRGPGSVDTTLMAPSLPPAMVAPSNDAVAAGEFAVSLRQAEQQFSDEAQAIGLGPAFRKFGAPDAMNMGGPANAGFVLGPDSIGAGLSDSIPSAPSTVVWKADRVIVASSGDLGITVGIIHEKADPAGRGYPFFTVWKRATPRDPWRYVAE